MFSAFELVSFGEREGVRWIEVGNFCLLQPLADGLKLFAKETILPSNANTVLFVMAPMITFILSMMGWAVIPFGEGIVLSNINVGIL